MQKGWRVTEPEGKPVLEDELKKITEHKEYVVKELRNLGPIEKKLLEEFYESPFEHFEDFLIQKNMVLKKEHINELKKYIEMEKGFSFLEVFMKDNDIEEISIMGNGKVYVYVKKHGWLKANIKIMDEDFVYRLANRIAKEIDRRITLKNPRVNANIPLGRVHACIQPISNTNTITVRKFRKEPFTPQELVETNTTTWKTIALLWMCMLCDMNIVIAGNTGSGKTTTLNVLASFVPERERIVIIEETPELNLPHEHCIRLIPNPDIKIEFSDLVKDTLRMRPDRVFISEIRTQKETNAFIETILCGQGKGSYTTYHSQSVKEFISRMKFQGVQEEDLNAIDIIIIQRRWSTRNGEVRKIIRIHSIRDNKDIVNRIPEHIKEKLKDYFGKNISSEIKQRIEFLKSLKNTDFKTTVERIWDYDG